MSATDEETVRSMYAGFSTLASGGDVRAYVETHYAPDCEYHPAEEGTAVRGRDALVRWNERWFEAWSELDAKVDELTAIDAGWLAEITVSGIGRGSGLRAEQRIIHLIELERGRITLMREHLDRDQALRAARG